MEKDDTVDKDGLGTTTSPEFNHRVPSVGGTEVVGRGVSGHQGVCSSVDVRSHRFRTCVT